METEDTIDGLDQAEELIQLDQVNKSPFQDYGLMEVIYISNIPNVLIILDIGANRVRWPNWNWGTHNTGERIFYTTHDRGKVVWWDITATPGGDINVCHPFCNNNCYFPFNWRYCAGNDCRANVNGDPITPPQTIAGGPWDTRQTSPPRDVVRSHPPQCTPDAWDNGGQWRNNFGKTFNNNFNEPWFNTGANRNSAANPFTAVPLARAPPPMPTLLNAVIPGTAPPPFAPVPHSE
jgi:hypothetical protein